MIVIDRGVEEELPLPRGYAVRGDPGSANATTSRTTVAASYRGAAPGPPADRAGSLRLVWHWRWRWGLVGCVMLLPGSLFTLGAVLMLATVLGLIEGTVHGSSWSLLVPTAMGGTALCIALSLLLNRTEITIEPDGVVRAVRPLHWQRPVRWERQPGDRVVTRTVPPSPLRGTSLERYQVAIERADGARELVLLDDLRWPGEAKQLAAVLRALLRCSSS